MTDVDCRDCPRLRVLQGLGPCRGLRRLVLRGCRSLGARALRDLLPSALPALLNLDLSRTAVESLEALACAGQPGRPTSGTGSGAVDARRVQQA